MMIIRSERIEDLQIVRQVNEQAFGRTDEADLVDFLRRRGKLIISLVAEVDSQIVGHIGFSRVRIDTADRVRGIGLGPLAISPGSQKLGIGSQLVRAGIDKCREMKFDFVVVLGHPQYYPRFGFIPASLYGIGCQWTVADDVFMILELQKGALKGVNGSAAYEPEFNHV